MWLPPALSHQQTSKLGKLVHTIDFKNTRLPLNCIQPVLFVSVNLHRPRNLNRPECELQFSFPPSPQFNTPADKIYPPGALATLPYENTFYSTVQIREGRGRAIYILFYNYVYDSRPFYPIGAVHCTALQDF
jgi:hypothetical protein